MIIILIIIIQVTKNIIWVCLKIGRAQPIPSHVFEHHVQTDSRRGQKHQAITTFLGGGLTIAGLTITALIPLDGILQFQMDCWHKTRSAPFFSPPKLTCRWMFIPLKSG